jgi:hypothetical protein
VSERRCRMGFGVAGNYWWQGQNGFSEKQIGELLDSWAKGQVRTSGQVFVFERNLNLNIMFVFVFCILLMRRFLVGLSFLGARRTNFAAAGI